MHMNAVGYAGSNSSSGAWPRVLRPALVLGLAALSLVVSACGGSNGPAPLDSQTDKQVADVMQRLTQHLQLQPELERAQEKQLALLRKSDPLIAEYKLTHSPAVLAKIVTIEPGVVKYGRAGGPAGLSASALKDRDAARKHAVESPNCLGVQRLVEALTSSARGRSGLAKVPSQGMTLTAVLTSAVNDFQTLRCFEAADALKAVRRSLT